MKKLLSLVLVLFTFNSYSGETIEANRHCVAEDMGFGFHLEYVIERNEKLGKLGVLHQIIFDSQKKSRTISHSDKLNVVTIDPQGKEFYGALKVGVLIIQDEVSGQFKEESGSLVKGLECTSNVELEISDY